MGQAETPVDLHHLDRYTGGERSLDAEILKLFDNQCQEMMVQLERLAAEDADTKAWREVTHTLKGAARGIGAFPLADAAAEAEKSGSDRVAAIAALQVIKAKAAAVQAFIEQFLKADA
jgi:HPt (histidine-containing phosphotransfer) domain-containing protein